MQFFSDAASLLEMFSVDVNSAGAEDFINFVELSAYAMAYPELRVRPQDVAAAMMSELGLSPMVFWSRIKRHCRPLYEADRAALCALGLSIDESAMVTGYSLGVAAAGVVLESCRSYYDAHPEGAQRIAELCAPYRKKR